MCALFGEESLDLIYFFSGGLQRTVFQNQAEFITTQTRKQILIADLFFYSLYKMAEIPVAFCVPIGIIDMFQRIQITVAEDKLRVGFQEFVHFLMEIIPVADTGQSVKICFLFQFSLF